jgi:putative peptidoglycan lipid II flippase
LSKKLKDIGVVSLLTVISRVLGLVRDMLALAIFGTTTLMSAFYAAYTIPNLFRRLLAEGSLTAVFIPTLQEELHLNGRKGVYGLLSQVACWLLAITGVITALAMLFFSHARLLPGREEKWYITADLTVILFPYLAMISLAAAFNATLNILDHFTEPALSPIWLNLTMIVSLAGAGLHFAHSPMGEMHWLCAGVLVGGFLQMAVPAGVLIYEGWRPELGLILSPRVREIALLMTPGLLGSAIYQINIAVGRYLALLINDAGVTEMYSANRLMEFPIAVFAIAVSTVVYPLIARHAQAGDRRALADDFLKGLRLILIINVPAAAGLALLSRPIVRLLYEHGKVDATGAHDIAVLLAIFAIGLPFFSIVNLTIRAFYAVKDISTPVRIAAVDFAINVVVSLALMRWLGVPGLVLASTAAIIAQSLLFRRALRRRFPDVKLGTLLPTLGKILAGTAVMAVVVEGSWLALGRTGLGDRAVAIVAVAGLIPLGIAAYSLVIWLLKIEGRDELDLLLRRLRPGPKGRSKA